MLQIIDHGEVHELCLTRPPANALNPEILEKIIESLRMAADQAEAVVVSGLPGMFSAGLDVPELLQLDRAEMNTFWKRFTDMLQIIATLPIPVAFAMTGHAPAGGIVMALFGDYRIMPMGGFKTGLNEVQVGLAVSQPIHRALVRAVGPHTAERILVSGELMPSEKAKAIGLVDELAEDPAATVVRAIEWCRQHLALPRQAMLTTRKMARADLHGFFAAESNLGVDDFVDIWFSEATQVALGALVKRLAR